MLAVKQIEAVNPKASPTACLIATGCTPLYVYAWEKVWHLRFKLSGKERILTVGKYYLVSLQEARDKAELARKVCSHTQLLIGF